MLNTYLTRNVAENILIFLLTEVIVGCRLIQLIINYLEDKPPGSQSPMDSYHQITL